MDYMHTNFYVNLPANYQNNPSMMPNSNHHQQPEISSTSMMIDNNTNNNKNRSQNYHQAFSKTLWMGNIDEKIDENIIQYAFNSMGIEVYNIKIIKNKENGLPVGYAFVSFNDVNTAQKALQELNGKSIPNCDKNKQFLLKPANRTGRFSIFVGNLPPQINNETLMNAFLSYYPSVSSAKVIMNEGVSKGFGFVSFDNQNDYYDALRQQTMMLYSYPISVSKARNNNHGPSSNHSRSKRYPVSYYNNDQHHNNYHEQQQVYYQNYY